MIKDATISFGFTLAAHKRAHTREDFFKIKQNTAAVADGVTLWPGIEYPKNKSYPKKSGAAAVAKLAVKTLTNSIKTDSKNPLCEIRKAFQHANQVIARYNKRHNRSKRYAPDNTRNLFATTAAVGFIKNGILYFGKICDGGIAVIEAKKRKVRFARTECCHCEDKKTLRYLQKLSPAVRLHFSRMNLTNKIKGGNKKSGYGVLNGEKNALRFIEVGKITLNNADIVLLLTDGFASYLENKELLRVICAQKEISSIKVRIIKLSKKLARCNPKIFGLERTLVVLKKRYTRTH